MHVETLKYYGLERKPILLFGVILIIQFSYDVRMYPVGPQTHSPTGQHSVPAERPHHHAGARQDRDPARPGYSH